MNKKIEGIDEEFQELEEMLKNIDFSKKVDKDEIYNKTLKSIKCKEGKKMIRNKYKKITAVAASLFIISTVLVKPTWAKEMIDGIKNMISFGNARYVQCKDEGYPLPDFCQGKVFDKDGNLVTETNPYNREEKLYTEDGKEIFEMKDGKIITIDEKDNYIVKHKDLESINDNIGFTAKFAGYIPEGYKFSEAYSEKYHDYDTKDEIINLRITFKDNDDNTLELSEFYMDGKPAASMNAQGMKPMKINGNDGVLFDDGHISWSSDDIMYILKGSNLDTQELIKISESIK